MSDRNDNVLHRFDELSRSDADAGGGIEARRSALRLPSVLCRAAVKVLPVDGAAISVRLGSDVAVPIGASCDETAAAEQIEYTMGHGPCISAAVIGRRVLVPDLGGADALLAWPGYVAEIVRRSPFRAVFSFPLALEGMAMGSLNLYLRTTVGSVAETLVERAENICLRMTRALRTADLFSEPEHRHAWMDGERARRRRTVWLAQGMTMQAGPASAREALTLLRARAYADDRLLDDLAADVVQGLAAPPRLAD